VGKLNARTAHHVERFISPNHLLEKFCFLDIRADKAILEIVGSIIDIVMAKIRKVIETALYCARLETSIAFYTQILQLKPMIQDNRFCAFDVNGESVFLLFQQGASTTSQKIPGGIIPPHDGFGPMHMAFAIDATELSDWEQRLKHHGVTLISRVQWPLGGTSIYFHDPDAHLIELATPGIWKIY